MALTKMTRFRVDIHNLLAEHATEYARNGSLVALLSHDGTSDGPESYLYLTAKETRQLAADLLRAAEVLEATPVTPVKVQS